MSGSNRGAALVDLVFACGVAAVLCGIAVPTAYATQQRDEGRMAARHLANRLQVARLDAIRRNAAVAMRFDPTEPGLMRLYQDSDGDGVSQRDIDRGEDPAIESATRLRDYFGTAALRVAADVPAPEGGGVITGGSDPIRLGNSNLLSFTPQGGATGGTLYLAATDDPQLCIRIVGATGRIRVLRFDRATGAWRQD